LTRCFGWTLNASDRLAFAVVIAGGKPMNAPMDNVYETLQVDRDDITKLEEYLQEYFTSIMKKVKEIDFEQSKKKKKKKSSFFK